MTLPCPFAAAAGCAALNGPGRVVAFPAIRFLISAGSSTFGDGAAGGTSPPPTAGGNPAPTIAAAVEFAAALI